MDLTEALEAGSDRRTAMMDSEQETELSEDAAYLKAAHCSATSHFAAIQKNNILQAFLLFSMRHPNLCIDLLAI